MSVLDIRDLNLTIGQTPILKGVSLSVAPGEILGLVGESGSGKSMTALAVLGLTPPRATLTGDIRLNGRAISNAPDALMQQMRGREVGIVFQEPMTALNPVMTIGDQVAETVRLHRKVSRKAALAVARSVLDRVGLPADRFPLTRYPHELSGGQRQRVAIAIAIALTPKLLIADEATTALDVTTQAQVLDLLKRLVREDGMGLILITHDLAVVAETCDRLAVMKDGEVVEEAPVGRIRTGMTHPYSQRLLANATHAPVRRSRPQADAAPVLEVQGLVRDYGGAPALFGKSRTFRAVDDVSLSIQPGESVGLVGESGCGKSTLLRAILALEPPQAGRVRVKGRDITAARGAARKAIRRDIQVVFQDPYGSFDPRWKVRDLVAENFHLLDVRPDPAEARRRIDEMLERVGLASGAADRYPHEFSGGQRQRIAIARALITEPSVICLDEAVSALDVSVRAQVLDLLADLSDRLGLSYLFVTHDLGVVRSVTDRLLVMQGGRIVEQGQTAAVFAAPAHPYTQKLLAATPDLVRNPVLEKETAR
ncbi:ABC transporter ATP-binding protein [Brevundimonas sp. SORGH_AS_0993]|uniref:ABC transporter ATP-binding protein n=1 Tax=Brevundimonas sp. SORGH_AS_0993 TaxID=3041794 RepID=UPI00278590FD|nr:dipeptide ABC transporter ATP-binding protein [Brevundimonas sp. SORGH_AS_0993]MDQ1155307.1 peptide/nickel transport system ATP-binding protein [Brevundimonas sp. SORGH_AS_0993]